MFRYKTNLFHEHKNVIKSLDEELANINDCFMAYKLSLNVEKAIYPLTW